MLSYITVIYSSLKGKRGRDSGFEKYLKYLKQVKRV